MKNNILCLFILYWALQINAGVHEQLKPLLIDLPGWQGQAITGSSSNNNHFYMMNASRLYTHEDQSIHAVIFISDQISEMEWLDKNLQFESAGTSISSKEIDGFQVFQVHRQLKKEIMIIVVIHRDNREGIFLSLIFKNVCIDDTMELARLFDWNYIQFITSSF